MQCAPTWFFLQTPRPTIDRLFRKKVKIPYEHSLHISRLCVAVTGCIVPVVTIYPVMTEFLKDALDGPFKWLEQMI